MRIIQAECTLRYSGRCETFLEAANRLILVKDDGSVMIHVDSGIKPLNYMKSSKDIQFVEQDGHQMLYAANKKERLIVDLLEIHQDIYLPFPDSEREMVKEGTEDALQERIFAEYDSLVPGHIGVCREFQTGKGPVDVLGMSTDGTEVSLIEVKRHAHRKDVYQALKYGDGVDNMVDEYREQGWTSVEAKSKGSHDEEGTMISVDAFANRKLYLAAAKFAKGTKEEAAEHDVGIIDMGQHDQDLLKEKIESSCSGEHLTNVEELLRRKEEEAAEAEREAEEKRASKKKKSSDKTTSGDDSKKKKNITNDTDGNTVSADPTADEEAIAAVIDDTLFF